MRPVTDFGRFQLESIECTAENIDDIKIFANKPISDLCSRKNMDLLVFPNEIDYYGEEIGMKSICHLTDTTIETGDVMGFVGCNETSLSIRSRFAKDGENDNFLHYMLKEVFAINLLDLKHSISKDNVLELFIYLFPYHLKKALRQGIFKLYQTKKYNNANVRGVVDVSRHIRENIPFGGKVSYSTREFAYDNEVTQLIRHTIEFIKKHPIGKYILKGKDLEDCVNIIVEATPSYKALELNSIISKNIKPIRHPYYTNYRRLQQICLQILRKKGGKYGEGKNKVYGILFSGSWLWEEYVGNVLKDGFIHYYKNKGRKFNLFESPYYQQIVPDYIQWASDGKTPIFVADAKYIRLDEGGYYGQEKALAIYYKTITYMYYLGVPAGFLLYPSSINEKIEKMKISNNNSFIIKLPLKIPNGDMGYTEFCKLMKMSESKFKNNLSTIKNSICYSI